MLGADLAHLFLGKTRAHPCDIYEVPLHNPHVDQVTTFEVLKLLPLPLALAFLLIQSLLTNETGQPRGFSRRQAQEANALVRTDWLEGHAFFSVRAPARRASTIEILFDMVPAESTDLVGVTCEW